MVKNYLFRVVDEDNNPTGHYGFVSSNNFKELFWALDEYVNPYSCEVFKLGDEELRMLTFSLKIGDQENSEYENPYIEELIEGADFKKIKFPTRKILYS